MEKAIKTKRRGAMAILIFLMIISISFGWMNGWYAHKNYSKCIFIPDSRAITSFCQKNGYKYGWLSSSSCGENQVQCFKEFGNARYYDCININITAIEQANDILRPAKAGGI